MDWDTCNHRKLNQRNSEAKRWLADEQTPKPNEAKRRKRTQPAKRKKKGKA
jgi:hypothetical protein